MSSPVTWGKSVKKHSNSHEKELKPIFSYFINKEEIRKFELSKILWKRLWKIPQPEEFTFDGRGEKKIFHYTMGYDLSAVLKYGIIFGDTTISSLERINAPNLTTESRYHNPTNTQKYIRDENDIYRLTIKCPTDADKLFNMEWFDRTFCLNHIKNVIKGINESNRHTQEVKESYWNGEIHKQYIFKGHITPKMIKEVCRWNKETEYWDRVNKKQLSEICSRNDNFKFNSPKSDGLIIYDIKRVFGWCFTNDTTGMVKKYFEKTTHKEVLKDLYRLTDWCVLNLKGRLLYQWRQEVPVSRNKSVDDDELVGFAVEWYNRFNKNDEVDYQSLKMKIDQRVQDYANAVREYNKFPAIV